MFQLNMKLLSKIIPEYHKFIDDVEGQKWKEQVEIKDKFFSRHFSKEELPHLEEGTLRELIHMLWAFAVWTNKDYLLQEMLKSGIDKIRKAFSYLLYSDDPIYKRFDYVRSNVRMMGAAGISEMLALHDRSKYPVWNSRSKAGLIVLGIPETSLPKSLQISGSQYQTFCDLVEKVFSQIASKYPEFEDLFTLDFLLFYISLQKQIPPPPTEVIKEFDHDDVIEQVLKLGDGLGFEVQKEFNVTHGCKIDAIWRSRIANLGTIAYAFEVHRKGSRDSAILNLQRVKRDPSIQKVIIVSTEEEINKFRKEISSLDEDFRNSVGYFWVSDLQIALDNLESLKNILNKLGLLAVESFSV